MPEPSPPDQVARLASGYWHTQAIYVAAKLGIADLLTDGPRSVAELAGATHAHPHALYRLLRALASLGITAPVVEVVRGQPGDRVAQLRPRDVAHAARRTLGR